MRRQRHVKMKLKTWSVGNFSFPPVCLSFSLTHSHGVSLSHFHPFLSFSLFLSYGFSLTLVVSLFLQCHHSLSISILSLFLSQSIPCDIIRLIFNLSYILSSLLTLPVSLFLAVNFFLCLVILNCFLFDSVSLPFSYLSLTSQSVSFSALLSHCCLNCYCRFSAWSTPLFVSYHDPYSFSSVSFILSLPSHSNFR